MPSRDTNVSDLSERLLADAGQYNSDSIEEAGSRLKQARERNQQVNVDRNLGNWLCGGPSPAYLVPINVEK